MLKDKSILYIVHNYTSFQKDQIEEASKYFDKVYVLVRYKLVTVIANVLKLKVFQKYVNELGLEEKEKFVGLKPHNEIAKWIDSANLLVISSLGEGAPVVLMEALSCGVPVVGKKVGNIAEVLDSEEYGYVCNFKDVSALASAIKRVLLKNWNREKISEYGQQFTWTKANEKIVKIYSKLLKDK